MIFVCIPLHNRIHYTRACLQSVLKQSCDLQIIVCDDGSSDNTTSIIKKEFPSVIVLEGDGNLWWAGATNKCVQHALSLAADSDYIFTLNNDTELPEGSLVAHWQTALLHPNSIVAMLNLFFENHNRIENSGFIRTYAGLGFRRYHKYGQLRTEERGLKKVDGLAGKGVLIPVTVFRSIGLYDSLNLPHYHADLEFSIRAAKMGYNLWLNCDNELYSHQQLTGEGMVMTAPNLSEFFRSFSSIRSTHHLPSLRNYHKAVHGSLYTLFFLRDLLFICLGFLKRFTVHKLSIYSHST